MSSNDSRWALSPCESYRTVGRQKAALHLVTLDCRLGKEKIGALNADTPVSAGTGVAPNTPTQKVGPDPLPELNSGILLLAREIVMRPFK